MRLPFITRLLFVVLVVLEIGVFVGAVRWLGGWPVFWLVLATAFFGGWIIRIEGGRAWTATADALRTGRMPAQSGSGVRMVGGFLLVMPGFVSDVFGLLTLMPPTRSALRRAMSVLFPLIPPSAGPRRASRGPANGHNGPVIEGEVVDSDDDPPK